jgi:Glutaredoxin-like domain (DUF836)
MIPISAKRPETMHTSETLRDELPAAKAAERPDCRPAPARELQLLSTRGCHLCEQAEAVLRDVLSDHPDEVWTAIDIADHEALFHRYGESIPVLRDPNSHDELCWPFANTDVKRFIVCWRNRLAQSGVKSFAHQESEG